MKIVYRVAAQFMAHLAEIEQGRELDDRLGLKERLTVYTRVRSSALNASMLLSIARPIAATALPASATRSQDLTLHFWQCGSSISVASLAAQNPVKIRPGTTAVCPRGGRYVAGGVGKADRVSATARGDGLKAA